MLLAATAATGWSFAHLPLKLSDCTKKVLRPGCESGTTGNLYKKNVRSVRFFVKRRGYCCNVSVSVALNVRLTTTGCVRTMNVNAHADVARTSNNRAIAARDQDCCLLPQCEALRTCRSGFPIAVAPDFCIEDVCKTQRWRIDTNPLDNVRCMSEVSDYRFQKPSDFLTRHKRHNRIVILNICRSYCTTGDCTRGEFYGSQTHRIANSKPLAQGKEAFMGPTWNPLYQRKRETPTSVSAAVRGLSGTTAQRKSDASGNQCTDGRWHRIHGVHAVTEKLKPRSTTQVYGVPRPEWRKWLQISLPPRLGAPG